MIPEGVFAPDSAAWHRDRFAMYDALLAGPPLFRNADGSVVLVGYAPAAIALNEREAVRKCPELSLRAFRPGPFREHNAHSMTFMDPPDHTRVRRAMTHAFTPRALGRLEGVIATAATALLDRIGDEDRFDLVDRFAGPLPLAIICAILGLPDDDGVMLRRAAARVVAGLEPGASDDILDAADAAIGRLVAFLGGRLVARRPDAGAGDLLSMLASLPADEALSPDELVHQAIFLLNAGHETTTGAIANAAGLLIADPAVLARARAGALPWEGVADEALRLFPPLHFTFRRTVAALDLGQTIVPADATLLVVLAAANRDPAVFSAPDRFDPARANARRHLSFAAGCHTCLGAALARMEMAIGLRLLFERMPDLALDGPPSPSAGLIFRGVRAMPVRRGERH